MSELFRNVLTASFHGSIVILAVIVLRLVLKKTPKKFICLLWMLAGIRLLMPFEIQSSLSLQPDTSSVAEQQVQQWTPEPEILTFREEEPVTAGEDTPMIHNDTPAARIPGSSAAADAYVPAQVSERSDDAAADKAEPAVNWAALLPYFWLAVACCFGLSSVYSYLRLKYQVREAIKIPGGWESERIETAFILGFIRPQIYIPMGMSPSNRKYILAHERTHLEKGDHWFKMIGYIALAIHWFNPLVWVAYVLLCKDIEIACDERVVQFMELEERKRYSAALLSCSTNRAHYAACPVAFGEVSVKERIKSVLNYRKPSFWISLLGVIAIVFVAVCLVTNPTKEKAEPAAGETLPTEETVAVKEDGFASTLSESEIAYTCEKAIAELKSRDSYCIQVVSGGESTSQHYGVLNSTSTMRKSGRNSLSLSYEDGSLSAGASLVLDERYASFWGDKWVWDESSWNPEQDVDAWLDAYSPSGKLVTFPEGTGVVSGDTVSLFAQWTQENPFAQYYTGTYSFTFNDDGTLNTIVADYVHHVDEANGGGEVHYINALTVLNEDPAETDAQIRAIAAEAISQKELEEYRLLQDQVTEVPSNKTSYDQDFMLGSAQMGWKFAKGEWFFKFGAEDVTPTGAKLVVEYNGPYGNNTIQSGTVEAGAAYFIEQLVDGTWVEIPVVCDTFQTISPQVLGSGSTQTINWEANYGELPAGFYRIGNYYTFTSASGEQDVQVCYAKFRLYDPEMDVLLLKCRDSISDLLASDSYHILATHWRNMHNQSADDHYYTTEVWKHGADYLEESLYYYQVDNTLKSASGLMRRDGVYYDLNWVNDSCRNSVSSWDANTYAGEDNFQIWSWTYELYDGQIYEMTQEGNQIRAVEMSDFYEGIPYIETVFTFDDAGNLAGLSRAYVYENGDQLVDEEMVVFDSIPEEVGAFIDGQDLSRIATFSYAEDLTKYSNSDENVRTKNFVNTTAKSITGPLDAVDIAIRDCTLPASADLEPGTNISEVFYDAEAKMWKVEFTASWDSSIYQAVYLNAQGITQMTVQLELEVNY